MTDILIRFKSLIITAAIIIFGVLFLISPYFNFVEVTVVGNYQISTEEILERSGLNRTANFFLFNTRRAGYDIMENHYIDQVIFNRTFPGYLEVIIRERFISGYIEFQEGMFLYIDENGRAIEVRSYMEDELPIISGLRFTQVHMGEILEVENPEAFNTVVVFARLLNQHGLAGIISQLDVSDVNNTRIRLYNIEVNFGDTQNAQEKVLTLREIVDVWPAVRDAIGFLDLRNPGSEQILFRNLT